MRIARREHSSSAQDAGAGRACGVERSQKAVSWLPSESGAIKR